MSCAEEEGVAVGCTAFGLPCSEVRTPKAGVDVDADTGRDADVVGRREEGTGKDEFGGLVVTVLATGRARRDFGRTVVDDLAGGTAILYVGSLLTSRPSTIESLDCRAVEATLVRSEDVDALLMSCKEVVTCREGGLGAPRGTFSLEGGLRPFAVGITLERTKEDEVSETASDDPSALSSGAASKA